MNGWAKSGFFRASKNIQPRKKYEIIALMRVFESREEEEEFIETIAINTTTGSVTDISQKCKHSHLADYEKTSRVERGL
jgi:hypothetical protein